MGDQNVGRAGRPAPEHRDDSWEELSATSALVLLLAVVVFAVVSVGVLVHH